MPFSVVLALAAPGVIAAWRRRRGALLVLLPAAGSLLLSILLTAPLSRFRAALAPFLCVLAGLALARAWQALAARRLNALAATVGVVALTLVGGRALEARIRAEEPSLVAYRHHEFAIAARHYARQGRHRDAAQELEQLAELTSDDGVRASALVSAASSWFAAGDSARARAALDEAAPLSERDAQLRAAIERLRRDLSAAPDPQRRGLEFR